MPLQKAHRSGYGKEKSIAIGAHLKLQADTVQDGTEFMGVEAMQYVLSAVMLTAERVVRG
jgi:hypothetical protein